MDQVDGNGPLLSVEQFAVGGRIVLVVSGELDLAGVDEIKAALARAEKSAPHELWIDLSGVEFMDSTGLTTLVLAHRRFDEPTRRLAVICPDGSVRRLLALVGVDGVVPVYPSRAAAQAAG
jgi:anti-sigma B factor antagonist